MSYKPRIKLLKTNQGFYIQPLDIDYFDLLMEIKDMKRLFTTFRNVSKFDPKLRKRVNVSEVDKEFYIEDFRNERIYFVNTVYNYFKNLYKNRFEIEEDELPICPVDNIRLNINPEFKPRDYQEIFIEKIIEAKTPRLLIDLQTGKGKSFIAVYSMVKRGKKFALLILPRYIEKWIRDLKQYTDIKDEEILVIKGGNSIRYVESVDRKELSKYKVVILSLTTMREYINNYLDTNSEFKYGIEPRDFTCKLGIDTIVSDETHQEFHNVFYLTLLLDPNFLLSLTATLLPNTKKEEKIQELFFPDNYRLSNIIDYDKYTELIAVSYELAKANNVKAESGYGYSHSEFEKWLMKHKFSFKNYLEMILNLVKNFYLKYRVKGDEKCLIFAATVEMCKIIRDYLRENCEECKDLKIEKYTSEDDFKTLLDADIIVSTLGSAGVAVDIPRLICVINTVLMSSSKMNIQALGRLRKKLPDANVRFIYIWSRNYHKHRKYHYDRLKQYKDRVSHVRLLEYQKVI